jgi:membrane fusion protein (multidrug efflux system)
VLTTVSQVDPIRVYFPISEREYLNIAGKTKPGAVGDFLRGAQSVPLELILTNGATHAQKGRVIFADRQVDAQTGTIRIAAAFSNPGNVLRPGQFGRVRALTSIQTKALLVPQRAVSELQGQHQVAIVGSENKVHIQNVKVGEQFESYWVITEGLKGGERVITQGVTKVGEGVPVRPKLEGKAARS